MPSVVIHRYVKVGGDGVGRAKAHIRYIQHRRGDDREHQEEAVGGGRARREFFDGERDGLDRRELNKLIDREPAGGVAIHKLTLSPGVQGVDLREYTREVLDELGKMKGLDLNWAAVAHKNTNHDHVHVVVLGTDVNGRQVRLDKSDHDLLRYKSDQYLDREHAQDRELAREAKEAERVHKELGADRTQERLASLLGKGQKFEERDEWSKERALLEMPESEKITVRGRSSYTRYDSRNDLTALDKHLKGNYKDRIDRRQYAMLQRWIDAKERNGDDCHERWDRQRWLRGQKHGGRQARDSRRKGASEIYRKLPRKQFLIERQGRRSEYHATYMNLMAKQRLMQARERTNDIAIKRQIDKELELLKQMRQEQLKDVPLIDLDSLYGKGKDRKLEWKRQEPDRPLRVEEIKFDDLLSLAEEAHKKESEAKAERKGDKVKGEVDKERDPGSDEARDGDVEQRERDDSEEKREPENIGENAPQESDRQEQDDDPEKTRDKKEWDLLKDDLEQAAKDLKELDDKAKRMLKRQDEDDDREHER